MAARKGFRGNRAAIGRILRDDPGIGAALEAIAERTADESGGTVRKYTTDRQVVAVDVGAEDQAVNGAGTRAINRVRAFASKRDWRRAFAAGDADASRRAHASPSYSSLPESSS